MAQDAFDLAERLQTPVFVMSDLDLGMNTWMSDPFAVSRRKPLDRGKVLDAETLKRASATGAATRTSTATASRTARCPAPGMPAYFTRGSGHNEKAHYSERPDDFVNNLDRLTRKFDTARDARAAAGRRRRAGAKVGIIAYGTTHWAIVESRDQLAREAGLETDYLRLRAYPVQRRASASSSTPTIASTSSSRTATRRCSACCRQELARRSQIAKLRKVLHYNGLPIDARSVTDRHPRAGRRA